MPTTGSTPADEHDWDLRAPLTHEPDVLPQLQVSLCVLLGPDQLATNGEPIVGRQVPHGRPHTVQPLENIAVMDRRSDEPAGPRHLWLTTPSASDLAGALLVAARMIRIASLTD